MGQKIPQMVLNRDDRDVKISVLTAIMSSDVSLDITHLRI